MKKEWLIAGAIIGCTTGATLGACSSTAAAGPPRDDDAHDELGHDVDVDLVRHGGHAHHHDHVEHGRMTTTTGTGGTGNCSTWGRSTRPSRRRRDHLLPVQRVGDAGNAYCTATTEHCCETPAGGPISACAPIATACMMGAGYTDWQCEDPVADCKDPTKPVCCAPGASIGLGAAGCGNFAHTMKNTICVASGQCAGITMCTSDSECTSPMKCTPFGKAGNQVGGCM